MQQELLGHGYSSSNRRSLKRIVHYVICPITFLEECHHVRLVVCNDNAYMTDATWIKLAPDISKGIRLMPVIKDYPNWKVVVTLDGFFCHLVPASLEPFTVALIEVVKEEGVTSAVNQAYDQSVAKEDKKLTSSALNLVGSSRKLAVFNQETFVAICIHAIRNVNPKSWVALFRKVNQHPHHRMDIKAWCKKIESKLVTSKQFFKNRVGLFDAMPSFWKQMTDKNRHAVVGMIDGFYLSAKQNGERNSSPWTIKNFCKLVKYVALDDIYQLHGCYLTTKLTNLSLLSRINLQRWRPTLRSQIN